MAAARKSPGAAFVLSVVPGVGHLYAGRVGAGIGWLFAVFFCYQAFAGFAVLLHVICAATAAQAAAAANRAEEADLASRRETAEDVAKMLDEAVSRRGTPASPAPPAATDPPPRLVRGAFPVPPDRLVGSLGEAFAYEGLLVLGVDRPHLRVRGSADLGGGVFASVVGQVEATPSGSRVRLLFDRPPGAPRDPEADDAHLRRLLERTERLLAATTPPGEPRSAAVLGEAEALTEDNFLLQLREAWEAYEQGWLPEEEWLQRRRGLVSGVTLRAGTRFADFMAACRPLVEAGVLGHEDLDTLERNLRGA